MHLQEETMTCTCTKYCKNDHVQNVEIENAGSTYWRNKECTQNFRRIVKRLLRRRRGARGGASNKICLYEIGNMCEFGSLG
jgi:hypothetical protein